MFVELLVGVKWFIGLGRQFTRVTPLYSYGLAVLTFVSQVCLILAFLLPIKIVMLLGSTGVPHYFPDFLAATDHHRLIVLLSITSIAAYTLHASAELFAARASSRGAQRMLSATKKINLFGDQSHIAERAFRRYFTSAASLAFVCASLILLFALYPLAGSFLLGFYSLIAAAMVATASVYVSVRDHMYRNFRAWLNVETGFGFMLLFGLLITDFLVGASPGVLAAVVALILGRQSLNRLASAVRDVFSLYSERERLNAIFFSRRVLDTAAKADTSELWPLLMPGTRDQWVTRLIDNMIPAGSSEVFRVQWWEFRRKGVIGLVCERNGAAPLLLKIFDPGQRLAAAHEAQLLRAGLATLPAPPLVGVSEFRGHTLHLLGMTGTVTLPDGDGRVRAQQVQKELAVIAPPKGLLDSFARSRPMLWDRLSKLRLERIRVAADGTEDSRALDALIRRHETLKAELHRARLAIMNPDRSLHNMIQDEGGRITLLNWGHWSIEPTGSGFDPQHAGEALAQSPPGSGRRDGEESAEADRQRAVLAAAAYEMDRLCSQEAFAGALRLVPMLLDSLERVQRCTSDSKVAVLQ